VLELTLEQRRGGRLDVGIFDVGIGILDASVLDIGSGRCDRRDLGIRGRLRRTRRIRRRSWRRG
jgi:hypothetical protein